MDAFNKELNERLNGLTEGDLKFIKDAVEAAYKEGFDDGFDSCQETRSLLDM